MFLQGLDGADLILLVVFFYVAFKLIKRAIKEDKQERINNIKVYDYREVNNGNRIQKK